MPVRESTRDPRLDFFRGLGLLVIYSNHVAEISHRSVFMIFSWRMFGISDAAELFIFISGFLFGLIYYRTYLARGYWACQKKALARSGQIYLANLVTLVTVISLAYLFHRNHQKILETDDLDPFFTHTAHAIRSFILLDDMPGVFDVLFLYVFFLAFMPMLMAVFHRRPRTAVLLSALVYLVSFKDPVMKLVGICRLWGFALDPLAWQFLFFMGMILGMKKQNRTLKVPVTAGWLRMAAGFVVAVFALKIATYAIQFDLAGMGRWRAAAPWLLPLSGKMKLEPLRLVHFFALAYLMTAWLPAGSALLRTRPARLVIQCGQNSLKIFCSSLILSYLVCLIFARVSLGGALQFAIIVGGWVVLVLAGSMLTALKARRKEAQLVNRPATAEAALSGAAAAATSATADRFSAR